MTHVSLYGLSHYRGMEMFADEGNCTIGGQCNTLPDRYWTAS